jgi:hypothetical protein
MPDWKPEIRARLAGLRLSPTREVAIIEELSQHLDDFYERLVTNGAKLVGAGLALGIIAGLLLTSLNRHNNILLCHINIHQCLIAN